MPFSSVSARRERRRRLRRLGLLVPFALLASSASALDLYWKNPVSGFWGVGSNWTPLWFGGDFVPGPGDVAHIDSATLNAFKVTLDADVSVNALFSRASLDLAGHTLTLAGASTSEGALNLRNSSLAGAGTLLASGATTLENTNLGVGGTFTMTGLASIVGNNVINRNVVATGTTTFRQVNGTSGQYVNGTGTFTNAGTFIVDMGPEANSLHWFSDFVNAGTLTSVNGGFVNFGSFANTGKVNWGIGSALVGGTTFRNSGTITVSNLSGFSISTVTGDNTGGTIVSDASSVDLGGKWTTAGLGTLKAINGGIIYLFGTVDNAGATFDVAESGITDFRGATIVGGSVTHSDTMMKPYTRLTYDGAALDGGIRLDGDAQVFLQNGATLGVEDVRLGGGAEVTFRDVATTYNGAVSNVYGGYGTLRGTDLTLGAGAVATAYAPETGFSGLRIIATGALTNFGNLHANASGQLSAFSTGGAFRNVGLADTVGGGSLYLAGKTFDNASGTILLDASTLTFGGDTTLAGIGSITGTNGSNVRYGSGTLAFGGGTLDLARFGTGARFGLSGGTLSNGSIANSDLLAEDSGGTLSNVSLDKGLRISGGYLQGTGTIDIAGDLQLLTRNGSQSSTLISTGDVTFHGGNATIDGSTFGAKTITGLSKVVISGNGAINSNEGALGLDELSLDGFSHAFAHGASTIDRLVSSGLSYSENGITAPGLTLGDVSVTAGGLNLSTDGHGRVQVNGDLSVDGTLTGTTFTDALDVNGGTVSGTGNIARLYLHGATLAAGHSTGHLNVGDITLDAASRFELEIGGDASTGLFDSLSNDYLYGNISLGGTLDLSLVNGYVPTSAQTWRFVEANFTNRLSGTFSALNLGRGWTYGQDATGAFVSYAPVPEPASLAALGLGLATLVRRRRK